MLPQFVLLPLYIYPSTNAWSSVNTAVAANPNLQFNIIINPNSGPGSTTYPDSNYIAGVSKLNAYANTKLIGYVPVDWTARSKSSVISDISHYAGWSKYTGADIHMDGIFFDEAPSVYNTTTSSYMSTVAAQVKTSLGSSRDYVVFNPGTAVDSRFFNYANTIVTYENPASSFTISKATASLPSSVRAKMAVLLHTSSISTASQTTLLNSITSAGIPGIYITSSSNFQAIAKYWTSFCSAMTATKYKVYSAKFRLLRG